MRTAAHPRVGTLPDFGNFHLGDGVWYDRYKGVAELMPWAKAVSAKSYDFDEQGEETHTDYRRMLSIVLGAGYHGCDRHRVRGPDARRDRGHQADQGPARARARPALAVDRAALELEQRPLAPQAAAVAAQAPVLVHHAVAGDHDRDPVLRRWPGRRRAGLRGGPRPRPPARRSASRRRGSPGAHCQTARWNSVPASCTGTSNARRRPAKYSSSSPSSSSRCSLRPGTRAVARRAPQGVHLAGRARAGRRTRAA